jgi:hypothetical protein
MNPLSTSNLSAVWQKNINGKLEQTYGLNTPSKQLDSSNAPTEQFVSSTLAPKLEHQPLKEVPQKFVPTKEPSGDMAEMLAHIQEAETRYETHGNNTQGLIQAENRATAACFVQFEDSPKTIEHSQSLDGVLANLMAQAEPQKHGEHSVGHHQGHQSHAGTGHLGAHLGLEAGELKAQALQLKAQAMDIKSELHTTALDLKSQTVDLKSHAIDLKSHAVDAKSHAVDLKSHAVDAKSHAVSAKNDLAAETAQQLHHS